MQTHSDFSRKNAIFIEMKEAEKRKIEESQ